MDANRYLVAIDARLVAVPRGMGRYVEHLLKEFALLKSEFHFLVYVDSTTAGDRCPRADNIRIKRITRAPYPLWEQFLLPLALAADQPALLHSPGITSPLFLPRNTKPVVTIHDIIYLKKHLPRGTLYQRLGRAYYALCATWAAKRGRQLITISNYSKADIVRHLRVNEAAVHVTYLAGSFDVEIEQLTHIHSTREPSLGRPFILALAADDPRKNTSKVVEAFGRLISLAPSAPHQLVLVGNVKDRGPSLELIRYLQAQERLVSLGFVNDLTLATMFRNADIFVYPSLYEGFGIPVVDAMRFGCPVVCSNTTSLPEIVGDAAVTVDPCSVDGIAAALARIVHDGAFARVLRTKGPARAAQFSWRTTAEHTLEVYRKVLRA